MILNRQRRVRIPLRDLDRFAASASQLLRLPADSVTVCLVNDAEMAKWNRAYRGKNRPTDVLSFPVSSASAIHRRRRSPRNSERRAISASEPDPLDPRSDYLGDIAIAPAVARVNALRFGRPFEVEMRMLILHGMLHLIGYDHETDRGQMDRRERRLRRELGLE
jgi:probable rRNA maturation factor